MYSSLKSVVTHSIDDKKISAWVAYQDFTNRILRIKRKNEKYKGSKVSLWKLYRMHVWSWTQTETEIERERDYSLSNEGVRRHPIETMLIRGHFTR